MRIYLYLTALAIVIGSCQDNSSSKKVGQDNKDTGTYSNTTVVYKTSDTLNIESFPEFWKIFRTAVLYSDTNQIIAMTKFPFQTRGPLDSDPIIEYNKLKFLPVFQAFLNQWNGMDLEETTELESIKKTITPSKADITNDYARIGDLEFNKKDKGWKLVFAYLNNETIDSLNK